MNTDFRMSIVVLTNSKIQKLIRKKGADGFLNLVSLWSSTAAHNPDGVLTGFDKEDVMAFASTNDESFTDLLITIGLLDFDDGVYKIHNWSKNNPWAIGAEKRSETARKAATARWSKGKTDAS